MTMRHALAVLTALVTSAGIPALATDTPGGEPLSDQGILELLPGVSIDEVNARYGFTTLNSIPSQNIHLVSFQPALTEDAFELLFLADPDIDHSELNHASGDPGPDTQSTFVNRTQLDFLNDPTWGSLGLNAAHQTAQGDGVLVAVLDTGLDADHPMFAGAIHPAATSFVPGFSALSDSGNGIDEDGDGNTDKMAGHGTHVAGIIRHVAPGCTILPVRVMDDEGYGSAFVVAKGIYYAADQGARVINLSLSSQADLRIIERAARYAADRGALVIAAAGNQGSLIPEYPANTNEVVGVGACDDAGVVASFSNYGDHLLVFAPGVDMPGPTPGDTYGETDGTSTSVPIVAGTAALLIQQHIVVRYDAFRSMLRSTAINIEAQNPTIDDRDLGFGMLSVEGALNWVGPCNADLDDDDDHDIDDLELFVDAFIAQDPAADLVPGYGSWDIDDIEFFVQFYLAGCPDE